jgi:hypothetical protein
VRHDPSAKSWLPGDIEGKAGRTGILAIHSIDFAVSLGQRDVS